MFVVLILSLLGGYLIGRAHEWRIWNARIEWRSGAWRKRELRDHMDAPPR